MTKALICVGNVRRRVNVQFVGRGGSDTFTMPASLKTTVDELGEACEFEVFVTPPCTCSARDVVMLTGMTTGKESFNHQVDVDVITTATTKLHHDDDVVAEQMGRAASLPTMANSTTTTLWPQ